MDNGYAKVSKTPEGKYFGQVKRTEGMRTVTYYETPEYLTSDMAATDANCWRAFHMVENRSTKPEYTICEDDKVYEFGSKLNTGKVVDMITGVSNHPKAAYKVGPLTGRMVEFEGFKLSLYMPVDKFWRTFDVIKSDSK